MDNFSFTKLVVGNLEEAAAFYSSVCGLTESARVDAIIDGRPISEIMYNPTASGGPTFVLLAFLDAPEPASSEVILGFITADLAGFLDRARDAGGSIVEEIVSRPEHGVMVAFVRDIEGHLIEVVQLV